MRDLIRAVRACKTAAEERAVISKECALIRTAIKEEDEHYRQRNVAKLMYIHMLGYPTHFGQMECLKLISASGFPEKRIGYLALTLLLNEQAEVLTLVTNSLKIDLSSHSQYIQALSLITIGNLSTQDMARDLASDVEKLLRSTNSYLRKKAVLATIRLLRKEPDLLEHFGERIAGLLKDRAHGVLISGLQLIIEVLEIAPEMKPEYEKLVPALVRLLRNFISMGFSPEHDVGGITDPFIQVKLLTVLRLLGRGSEEASEQMNDVLAQVATNTETSKNAGNAILYECVQTIMEVQSDSSLRVLAVNILGRFLLNRDNNIRYVALNSLSRMVVDDIAAVQRHRNTIVECLKDSDVTIRQRAMELIYQLVDAENVVTLTAELLNYLVVAQTEHKPNLVSKIIQIVEKYSPSKKWRVDTIITMLSLAGNQVEDSVPRTAIIFLTQADGLQGYATHRLYRAVIDDSSQQALLHVGIWCIGEHGGLLTQPYTSRDADMDGQTYSAVSETDIVTLLEKTLRLHNADNITRAFLLNAFVKLSVRLSASIRPKIGELISQFKTSLSLELQQRSLEYSAIMNGRWDGIRGNVLSNMPHIDEAVLRRRRAVLDEEGSPTKGKGYASNSLATGPTGNLPVPSKASTNAPSLIDLDDIFGLSSTPASAPAAVSAPVGATGSFGLGAFGAAPALSPAKPNGNANLDLLSDIFSTSSTISPQAPAAAPAFDPFAPKPVTMQQPGLMQPSIMQPTVMQPSVMQPMVGGLGAMNGFNNPATAAMPPAAMMGFPAAVPTTPTMSALNPVTVGPAPIVAHDKDGFKVVIEMWKPNATAPANTQLLCRYTNSTGYPITDFVFQAAVPKYLKLEMMPPSSATILANSNGAVTQEMKVTNSVQGEKPIMLKLKILYKLNGQPVSIMITCVVVYNIHHDICCCMLLDIFHLTYFLIFFCIMYVGGNHDFGCILPADLLKF